MGSQIHHNTVGYTVPTLGVATADCELHYRFTNRMLFFLTRPFYLYRLVADAIMHNWASNEPDCMYLDFSTGTQRLTRTCLVAEFINRRTTHLLPFCYVCFVVYFIRCFCSWLKSQTRGSQNLPLSHLSVHSICVLNQGPGIFYILDSPGLLKSH